METREDVQKLFAQLSDSVWALCTVAAARESGVLDALGEPRTEAEIAAAGRLPTALVRPVLDTLVALELVRTEGDRFVASPGLKALLAPPWDTWLTSDLRATLGQSVALHAGARRGTLALGWSHTDEDILQAQGGYAVSQFSLMEKGFFPRVPGLLDKLRAPGAAVLDVGAGVAGSCIAFCRGFPGLRAVGLEPAEVPLALARKNVAEAGLADRIELRAQRVEELPDEAAFAFAWLPQMFLPDDALEAGLRAVHRSLAPGGWLLTAAFSRPGPGLGAALGRVRNTVFGGGTRPAEELERQLRAAGFVDVMAIPAPGSVQPVLGRRA